MVKQLPHFGHIRSEVAAWPWTLSNRILSLHLQINDMYQWLWLQFVHSWRWVRETSETCRVTRQYNKDCLELHLVGLIKTWIYDARKYERKIYNSFFVVDGCNTINSIWNCVPCESNPCL